MLSECFVQRRWHLSFRCPCGRPRPRVTPCAAILGDSRVISIVGYRRAGRSIDQQHLDRWPRRVPTKRCRSSKLICRISRTAMTAMPRRPGSARTTVPAATHRAGGRSKPRSLNSGIVKSTAAELLILLTKIADGWLRVRYGSSAHWNSDEIPV